MVKLACWSDVNHLGLTLLAGNSDGLVWFAFDPVGVNVVFALIQSGLIAKTMPNNCYLLFRWEDLFRNWNLKPINCCNFSSYANKHNRGLKTNCPYRREMLRYVKIFWFGQETGYMICGTRGCFSTPLIKNSLANLLIHLLI